MELLRGKGLLSFFSGVFSVVQESHDFFFSKIFSIFTLLLGLLLIFYFYGLY